MNIPEITTTKPGSDADTGSPHKQSRKLRLSVAETKEESERREPLTPIREFDEGSFCNSLCRQFRFLRNSLSNTRPHLTSFLILFIHFQIRNRRLAASRELVE